MSVRQLKGKVIKRTNNISTGGERPEMLHYKSCAHRVARVWVQAPIEAAAEAAMGQKCSQVLLP